MTAYKKKKFIMLEFPCTSKCVSKIALKLIFFFQFLNQIKFNVRIIEILFFLCCSTATGDLKWIIILIIFKFTVYFGSESNISITTSFYWKFPEPISILGVYHKFYLNYSVENFQQFKQWMRYADIQSIMHYDIQFWRYFDQISYGCWWIWKKISEGF